MSDYKILLSTCDKYVKAVLPYAYLLKKYWPNHPEVVVGGFSEPDFAMPERFTFLSIGEQEDYPVNKWSDQIYRFINLVGDDVFIFTLEDMWIIEPVKLGVVKMAYDYMEQFKYVARLDLTGDRLHAGGARFYGKMGNVDLIWSDPDGQYHMSTMPAFWRKEHLERVLIPGETPWQVEINGTPRLGHWRDLCIVLGTNAWPVRNTLAFRNESMKLLLSEIADDDVKEMRALGLLEEWE